MLSVWVRGRERERRQEAKRVRVKITLLLKRRGLELKEHVCNLTIALKSAR